MLDSSSPNFRASLSSLDRLPTRFCDTVFVLYCREGMSKLEEILACQVQLFIPLHRSLVLLLLW